MMIDSNYISRQLSKRFGVDFNVYTDNNSKGFYIDVIPKDLDKLESFYIRIQKKWKSMEAKFVPGNYSAQFIKEMSQVNYKKKIVFKNIAKSILSSEYEIIISINNIDVDPLLPENWPDKWNKITLKIKKFPINYNEHKKQYIEELFISIASKITELVMSLLTLKQVYKNTGLPEGTKKTVEVNKYERNRLNRAACIDAKGTTCKVCGFNFKEFYGVIGEEYIHVHHIIPVSNLGKDYIIDPVKDLVPVCPNCHAMLHTRNPPLSIEELQSKIK